MTQTPLITSLIQSLTCLPGVGPKTAQRMAMELLERKRYAGKQLSVVLAQAMECVKHCKQCRNFTENDLCSICHDQRRDNSLLCVVETPADLLAIEQTGRFRGKYFVLMGRLSPLDGMGPEEIGLSQLLQQLDGVEEVILATNLTVEGEATANYISDRVAQKNIKVSRIAQGVPTGGELEYVDANTLGRAFVGRKEVLDI